MANKVVALDGGLVDIGSVANTESANIKDCLNYERGIEHGYTPVSYTHLTLPTIHVECRSRWSPYH